MSGRVGPQSWGWCCGGVKTPRSRETELVNWRASSIGQTNPGLKAQNPLNSTRQDVSVWAEYTTTVTSAPLQTGGSILRKRYVGLLTK